MTHVSELAILAHVREILFGKEHGAHGEHGWTSGAYHLVDNRVCLNAALHAAERDLTNYASLSYSEPLRTKRAKHAQRYLAEACYELNPRINRREREPNFASPLECHELIVHYNDRNGQTQAGIDKALQLAEKKAWEQWLEEHPLPEPEHEQLPVVIDDLLRETGRLTKESA